VDAARTITMVLEFDSLHAMDTVRPIASNIARDAAKLVDAAGYAINGIDAKGDNGVRIHWEIT
jgi:hypothetical protein